MQDEVRSKRLRVRRVKREENVADLGTNPLSEAVSSRRCLELGFVNMAEERVFEMSCHDVAMFWDFDSMQNGAKAKRKDPDVHDGRQYRQPAEVHDWRQYFQLGLLVTIQGRFTSIQPTLQRKSSKHSKFPTGTTNDLTSAAELCQATENLSEKPTDKEVDETQFEMPTWMAMDESTYDEFAETHVDVDSGPRFCLVS